MIIKNYQMIEYSNKNTENLSKTDLFPPLPKGSHWKWREDLFMSVRKYSIKKIRMM